MGMGMAAGVESGGWVHRILHAIDFREGFGFDYLLLSPVGEKAGRHFGVDAMNNTTNAFPGRVE